MIVIMTPVVALGDGDLVVSVLILDMLGNEAHRVDRFLKMRLLTKLTLSNPSSQLSQFYFSINVGSFIQVVSRLIGFLLDFAFFPSFIFSFLQICIHLFLNRVAKAAVVP